MLLPLVSALRERGILRPGRRLEIGLDRISLEVPPSVLHEVDLGFCPSVSLPSGSGSALEVARSLLDLGRPGQLGPGVARDHGSLGSSGAVSGASFSAVGPGPPGGSRHAGL